jgi:hypothetical protein
VKRHAEMCGFLVVALGLTAAAQKPPALVACTPVPRSTCEAVTSDLEVRQSLAALNGVQFVIADPGAFGREQDRSGDYVFAGIINKSQPGAMTPMLHSSFDKGIIFRVSDASILKCPDRVVVSTDMFRNDAAPGRKAGNGFDLGLAQSYVTFIQGYLEGCLGARQAR